MANPIAGKNLVVKVSTSSTPSATISGLKSVTLNPTPANLDVTYFSQNWVSRIQGLKDLSITLEGDFLSTDTNGQNKLRTYLTNGTKHYLFIYPNSTSSTGLKACVLSAGWELSASPDATVGVTYNFENASSSGLSGS